MRIYKRDLRYLVLQLLASGDAIQTAIILEMPDLLQEGMYLREKLRQEIKLILNS